MQPKKTFNKLFSFAENYMQLNGKLKSFRKDFSKARLQNLSYSVKRNRNLNHLREEIRKVPVPLSFTLNNMIVDQKIGKLL